MPSLPTSKCSIPLCFNRSEKGKGLCEEHKRERFKEEAKRTGFDRFYKSSAWVAVRDHHRKNNPFCVKCLEKGLLKAVEVVDHIIPRAQGGSNFETNNLQSLCHACHNSKRASERASEIKKEKLLKG